MNKVASTTHLPKTSGVEAIEKQIQKLQSDIADKCQQLNEQERLLSDSAESLRLLKVNTPWLPPAGTLAPLDGFKAHLENCRSEQEREAKIVEFQAGQQMSLQVYGRLEEELRELRSQLAELQDELVWQRDYAQFASQYEESFPAPLSPERSKAQSIERLQQNLQQHQLRLERAKNWLDRAQRKQDGSPHIYLEAWNYPAPASQVVQTYPQIIAQMELSLLNEQERIVPQDGHRDAKTEQMFRQYVISRVRIEKPLRQLLQAQAFYREALTDFCRVANENPQALPFPVSHLPHPLIRSIGIRNNEIFLQVDESAQLEARRRTSW